MKTVIFVVKFNDMAVITRLTQLDPDGVYSYADYLTWKFEQALELIKGKIFKLAAPSRNHQDIARQITWALMPYFQHHPCRLYFAPFDVRLFDRRKSVKADKDVFTVVQPDLCVVCDLGKLDAKGCLGAPDLMVEILSPGNSKREMKIKKELYAESGVREYWIVDPSHETVARYNLVSDDAFGEGVLFFSDESMPSIIFPDFTLALSELFPLQEEAPVTDNEERL